MAQVATVRLSVGEIVTNAISIGTRNFFPLMLTFLLYLFTLWIPYINIGTTIGIADMIARLGKGEKVNATDIFDAKYRKDIGDFILLFVFIAAALLAGNLLPGVGLIMTFSWMLAIPLFVDKGTDSLASLKTSNALMYGHKLTVFLSVLIIVAALMIGYGLCAFLMMRNMAVIGVLLFIVVLALIGPIYIGLISYVYGRLASQNLDGDTIAGMDGEPELA